MKNNKGFSLFTVLIAVSFVGILGLLVLYMALSNFNMKVTDLKGQFLYSGESNRRNQGRFAGGCG